jgi:hypothetical protein
MLFLKLKSFGQYQLESIICAFDAAITGEELKMHAPIKIGRDNGRWLRFEK